MPDPEYCRICDSSFDSWEAFHAHKLQSRYHICCSVCGQDFNTAGGLKRHRDLMHSHEQNLRCRLCHKSFIRLGGFICHIELNQCTGLDPAILKKSKSEIEHGRGSSANALPPARETAVPNSRIKQGSQPQLIPGLDATVPETTNSQQTNGRSAPLEEDLMSFDASPHRLNSPWNRDGLLPVSGPSMLSVPSKNGSQVVNIMDQPIAYNFEKALIPADTTKTFLPVPVSSLRDNTIAKVNQKPLFPDTPPAETISATLASALTLTPVEMVSVQQYNPDAPGFDAYQYYNKFSEKFKCPYPACPKVIATKSAFIQHLKSAAHLNEKLRCPNCLDYFASSTALTQHCESQGVRCRIREAGNYNSTVDEITIGMGKVAGLHVDNTIKYAINDAAFKPKAIVDANKAANEAREAVFNDYWKQHKPNW
ncbi:hypothetical protein F5884DRAFT_755254 [Xylogone sp. PMI_703]|nr:hypothetical protein F5884DRAFT_755254 [Xylogone sp. PMI_703]